MKKVRLIKLELTNYRNIEHEVFVFDGSNAKIVGENRIGKTNTLEAIYFLLSNYLLDGSSELTNIKSLKDTTKEVVVEGTFELFDDVTPQIPPREITLKKVYGEQWVKQRGTNELTMKGHYEKYFVNGIEQSREKDYQELLKEHFGVRNDEKVDIDPIQMLINPLYLGNLGDGSTKDWQSLRTYIVKLIGDVNDEEVFIKAPATLSIKQDLINALGKTDQLKKMYSNDIDTLKSQLNGYESQVELLEKTTNPSDEDVEKAKSELEAINVKIVELKTNGSKDAVVEQLEKEIFEVSKSIATKNREEYSAYLNRPNPQKENDNAIKVINEKINSFVDKLSSIQMKKGDLSISLRTKQALRDDLAKQYLDYNARIKDIDNQVLKECPTCHRPFDESEIETRKEEMENDLIAMRSKVVDEGQKTKVVLDDLTQQVNKLEEEEKSIKIEIGKLREELSNLNKQSFESVEFVESEELVALRNKEKDLQKQLSERKSKVSEQATNSYELATQLEQKRMEAQDVLNDRDYYERQMSLLKNIEVERKNVSNKLIDTEQKNEALKTYLYTKLRLLDEHIAKVFGKLRFQLIKENINGGFDPVCKPYIYDVDKDESTNVLWKSGSKSEKIITGITIVEAIRKELGLTELPYLFDEGGEISNETLRSKFHTDAQIICVRVEDNILKPIVVKF